MATSRAEVIQAIAEEVFEASADEQFGGSGQVLVDAGSEAFVVEFQNGEPVGVEPA